MNSKVFQSRNWPPSWWYWLPTADTIGWGPEWASASENCHHYATHVCRVSSRALLMIQTSGVFSPFKGKPNDTFATKE